MHACEQAEVHHLMAPYWELGTCMGPDRCRECRADTHLEAATFRIAELGAQCWLAGSHVCQGSWAGRWEEVFDFGCYTELNTGGFAPRFKSYG